MQIDDSKNGDDQGRVDRNIDGAVKFFGAVVILIFLMYWTWNDVGPSGKTTDIVSFIGLWFREFLLLGVLGLALLAACLIWLFRFLRKLFVRSGNAP